MTASNPRRREEARPGMPIMQVVDPETMLVRVKVNQADVHLLGVCRFCESLLDIDVRHGAFAVGSRFGNVDVFEADEPDAAVAMAQAFRGGRVVRHPVDPGP